MHTALLHVLIEECNGIQEQLTASFTALLYTQDLFLKRKEQ